MWMAFKIAIRGTQYAFHWAVTGVNQLTGLFKFANVADLDVAAH
jgi:hypothetical protein